MELNKLVLTLALWTLAFFSVAQPVADFDFDVDCYLVVYTDQSTCNGCSIVSWDWDFDDGSTSTQPNPVNYLVQPGIYNVQLVVTADNGLTHTVTMQVDTAGCTPLIIELTTDTVGCSISVSAPPGYVSYLWSTVQPLKASKLLVRASII